MKRIWGRFMPRRSMFFLIGAFALVLSPILLPAGDATASHSWGNYHWARTSNPFTLKLGDNVSSTWDGHLGTASTDWNVSVVLDTTIVPGTGGSSCKSSSGTVQVCNRKYGYNGWLGIAQIWIASDGQHITRGVTKMNDTYFNTPTYNKPAWRQFVMCQEIGHTFGLDHQDEAFDNSNLGSCMDYTNDPARNDGLGDNLHPNLHDYAQLELIYAHTDSYNTPTAAPASKGGAGPAFGQDGEDWGQAVRADGKGRPSVFVKDENGGKKITWVYWADAN